MNRWKEYLHRLDYMPILTQNAPRTREEFSLSVKLCVGVMGRKLPAFSENPFWLQERLPASRRFGDRAGVGGPGGS